MSRERAVPDCGDRPRIADRDEGRQVERGAMVPAFGDDFRPDPGGIAERDGQGPGGNAIIAARL